MATEVIARFDDLRPHHLASLLRWRRLPVTRNAIHNRYYYLQLAFRTLRPVETFMLPCLRLPQMQGCELDTADLVRGIGMPKTSRQYASSAVDLGACVQHTSESLFQCMTVSLTAPA